ncbi:predicted protein [Streptomyces filamentosus NRRL 15998]|uniref:Predicted protein n=1 Tax=Streptomyces filamentosus NRRL 15998 TaxID=457431 RepID=D6ARB4_STRFL|nr:predicted protein [Streptomyces filamentosus NRRL 15998]
MPVQGARPRPAVRLRARPARRRHPALHEGRPVTGLSTLLIVVGLFLAGGVYSFAKQGMPKGVIVLLSIGSVMCLVAGILRIQGLWD